MMYAKYLAVDPGTTTGLCWITRAGVIGHAQQAHLLARHNALDLLGSFHPDVIIMESFTLHAGVMKKSRQGPMDAIETLGTFRSVATIMDIDFVLQSPAQGKKVTNAMLKEKGLYTPKLEHANDAARHLGLYLTKKGEL